MEVQQSRNGRKRALALVSHGAVQPAERGGFAQMASVLLNNSYSPVPIMPGTKRPSLREWSRLCEVPLTLDEIAEISARHPTAGVAVACGFGGLVGIDVDTDDVEVHSAVRRAIGEGGCSRKGMKGLCAFYRLADDQPAPTRHFSRLLDVLGTGRCAIIPPTRHPSGTDYEWSTPSTLFNTRLERLPVVGER